MEYQGEISLVRQTSPSLSGMTLARALQNVPPPPYVDRLFFAPFASPTPSPPYGYPRLFFAFPLNPLKTNN